MCSHVYNICNQNIHIILWYTGGRYWCFDYICIMYMRIHFTTCNIWYTYNWCCFVVHRRVACTLRRGFKLLHVIYHTYTYTHTCMYITYVYMHTHLYNTHIKYNSFTDIYKYIHACIYMYIYVHAHASIQYICVYTILL